MTAGLPTVTALPSGGFPFALAILSPLFSEIRAHQQDAPWNNVIGIEWHREFHRASGDPSFGLHFLFGRNPEAAIEAFGRVADHSIGVVLSDTEERRKEIGGFGYTFEGENRDYSSLRVGDDELVSGLQRLQGKSKVTAANRLLLGDALASLDSFAPLTVPSKSSDKKLRELLLYGPHPKFMGEIPKPLIQMMSSLLDYYADERATIDYLRTLGADTYYTAENVPIKRQYFSLQPLLFCYQAGIVFHGIPVIAGQWATQQLTASLTDFLTFLGY